jgi:hypothetical protein
MIRILEGDPLKTSRLLCLLSLLAFFLGGCASSASIDSWKTEVDRYVTLHGGDPNALRDVTLADQRRGFGVIGQNDPRKSTDARALLLAHDQIAQKPWFIYLVGLVDKQKVKDIRLAARSQQPGQTPIWVMSKPDKKALKLYRDYNAGLWRRSQPDPHKKEPSSYTTFPRDADQFDVKIDGTRVTAIHPPSGAQWHVDVSQAKP